MKHQFKTPLRAVENYHGIEILDAENNSIASHMNHGKDMGESDAVRLVECANACAEIESPREYINSLKSKSERLEREKHGLKNALQGILETFCQFPSNGMSEKEIDAINDANEILTEIKK